MFYYTMKNIMSLTQISVHILAYVLAFGFGIILITYLLQLPQLLTGHTKIVNQYYKTNFLQNIPLDFVFVALYFLVGGLIIRLMKLKNISQKVLVIALTTAILTGGFCFYFRYFPKTKNFFSQWFHTVGYSSVAYDVILLAFIYLVYSQILAYVSS